MESIEWYIWYGMLWYAMVKHKFDITSVTSLFYTHFIVQVDTKNDRINSFIFTSFRLYNSIGYDRCVECFTMLKTQLNHNFYIGFLSTYIQITNLRLPSLCRWFA